MSMLPFGGSDPAASIDPDKHRASAVTLDGERAEHINRIAGETCGPVVKIKPYQHAEEWDRNMRFFRSMHPVRGAAMAHPERAAHPFAFELVRKREEKVIGVRYASPDPKTRREAKNDAESAYHNADIELTPSKFLDFREGDALSVCRLKQRVNTPPLHLLPVNTYRISPDDFDISPYDEITSAMSDDGGGVGASVVAQVTVKPAISTADRDHHDLNWHSEAGEAAEQFEDMTGDFRKAAFVDAAINVFTDQDVDEQYYHEDYEADKAKAKRVADIRNTLGYHVNVRILAAAETPRAAVERVEGVAEKYMSFYNADHGQGFAPVYPNARRVLDLADQTARREWVEYDEPMDMNIYALAGLAGPPWGISTPEYQETSEEKDGGISPSLPDFREYDQIGVTDEIEDFRRQQMSRDDTASVPSVADVSEDADDSATLRERVAGLLSLGGSDDDADDSEEGGA